MDSESLRPLKARLFLAARYLQHTQALWLRAVLCWALGFSFLLLESSNNFDLRFILRGPQKVDSSIVMISLGQQEWLDYHGQSRNLLRNLKEISATSDAFFWNPETLDKMLSRILADDPKSIGVAFFFEESLERDRRLQTFRALQNPKVIWGADLDADGRARLPVTTRNYASNVGMITLKFDDDRILRKFGSPLVQVPHLALKVSGKENNFIAGDMRFINFRGRHANFEQAPFREIMNGQLPKGFFKNKIVLIGSNDLDSHRLQTPVGEMNRTEIFANVVDNFLSKRWIELPPLLILTLYLLGILILSIAVINHYPQSIAFVFLIWLCMVITALSLWIFDSFYLWLPVMAPLAQIAVTYILMMGYQLTEKENLTWRLEQEKRLLFETEQQKSHFLSLISHDLKTPIAKIQAICDRLLNQNPDVELTFDLNSIRKESMELNRYIQTMLQVSRVESGNFRFQRDATDLNELIENVYQQILPLAKNKKIGLSCELEPLFSIEIDSILIQEVILNLVENAIKYTPEGGQVKISSREWDEWVSIEVEDNGPGVAKEEQQKIFEKFYRGETQRLASKGSGLGLFLVKYFIELHGGHVALESSATTGTRVRVDLPLG